MNSNSKVIPFIPYYYVKTSQVRDTKVKDLKTAYGSNGYAVYDFIVNEIFRTGECALSWCEDTICKVAEYWELDSMEVQKIVEYCVNIDLFNGDLYSKYHVLTSADLQNRYKHVCSSVILEPLALAVNS